MAEQGQDPTAQVEPVAPVTAPEPVQTFDAAYVASLRQEAAANRVAAKKAADELAAIKAAQMTDAEKQAARLSELEAREKTWQSERQELTTQAEVERLARRLGIVDEDAAAKLLDRSKLTFDASGKPENAEELLNALVAAKPWLKGAQVPASSPEPEPTIPASPANPAKPGGGRPLTLEDVRRMTRDQIQANWPQVEAALAAGK